MSQSLRIGSIDSKPLEQRFSLGEDGRQLPTRDCSSLLWFVYPEEFDQFQSGRITLEELRDRANQRENAVRDRGGAGVE